MDDKNLKIFKCLSDRSRLMIINSLLEGPKYVELLAERLSLSSSTISFHLKKLEEIGLVYSQKEQYYVVYNLNDELLSHTLKELIELESPEIDKQAEREENYRKGVIEAFFEYGKLKSIPIQQKKRKIVLEEIAKSFDAGKVYSERDVNIMLADYNDDFCTLRREMVAFKIMDRKNNQYWLVK